MDEHIGIEIFKILKECKTLSQQQLICKLECKGFNKNLSYIYIRYVLSVPLPISSGEWSEPMIVRDKGIINNIINISLNEYWVDVDEKDVRELFSNCNPDDY